VGIVQLLLLTAASFCLSYWLVGLVRGYALSAEVVDLPNDRSLHDGRVARGGGLAIVLIGLAGLIAATFFWGLTFDVSWPLMLVLLALGSLGWIDDHYDLPVMVRIILHFVVAAVIVAWLGKITSIEISPDLTFSLGVLSIPITLLWVVWMTNLYNFMDGSDGIAAVQGMIASAAMGLWFLWADGSGLAMVCLVLFAALSGFLVWNWSPARVFMGDVGSVSLGGLFAALSVVATTRYDMPFLAFVILFLVFIADATLTLVRRVARREPFWRAHRSHYYQRAVQAGLSHSRVACLSGALALLQAGIGTVVIAGIVPVWPGVLAGVLLMVIAGYGVIRVERVPANRVAGKIED
jgi:Fuc2NAc and GlcNAc transferase